MNNLLASSKTKIGKKFLMHFQSDIKKKFNKNESVSFTSGREQSNVNSGTYLCTHTCRLQCSAGIFLESRHSLFPIVVISYLKSKAG